MVVEEGFLPEFVMWMPIAFSGGLSNLILFIIFKRRKEKIIPRLMIGSSILFFAAIFYIALSAK